jgi:tetraacyldisaccharide 4'-kinase
MPRLLAPLAWIWGRVAERRLVTARPYRSALPVICIGNFTAGGTGKTPLSMLIAELLDSKGERTAFLTRGFGGSVSGPRRVETGADSAREVGDEALMLARYAPTTVARNRALGARSIESFSGPAPPTVIVMDDGLQNPDLEKDLSLAVVDGRRGFGNRRVIPAGPLRAPLGFQLERADVIVVNQQLQPALSPQCKSEGIATELRRRFPGPVLEAWVEADATDAQLAGASVVAFAGIANPQRFFALLDALGADMVDRIMFGDHHAFSENDARRLLERADATGARLVTTEKDRVRLIGLGGGLAELRQRSLALPIRLRLEARDTARLDSLLESALKRRRETAG